MLLGNIGEVASLLFLAFFDPSDEYDFPSFVYDGECDMEFFLWIYVDEVFELGWKCQGSLRRKCLGKRSLGVSKVIFMWVNWEQEFG